MAFKSSYDASKDHEHFNAGTLTTERNEKITVTVSSYDGKDPGMKVATVRRYTDFRGEERVDGKPGRLSAADALRYALALTNAAKWIERNPNATPSTGGKAPAGVAAKKPEPEVEVEEEEISPKARLKAKPEAKTPVEPEKKPGLPRRGSKWAKAK